jgi:RNA polymerase sigma-70 factor (ECF subfamily)
MPPVTCERQVQPDLIQRASKGDHEAFSALAADAFDRLYRTARLILRSDEMAADAVQEALVAAWLHIRAVREPENFDGWLYRLVVRACYREYRRQKRRSVIEVRAAPLVNWDQSDPTNPIANRDQIERAFVRLSPDQRAVLVVHYYLGMTESQAATALDVPIGTVKSRLNRAMRALRAAIEADQRAPLLSGGSAT